MLDEAARRKLNAHAHRMRSCALRELESMAALIEKAQDVWDAADEDWQESPEGDEEYDELEDWRNWIDNMYAELGNPTP